MWVKKHPRARSIILRSVIGVAVVLWIVVFLFKTFFTFPFPPIQAVFYQAKTSSIPEVYYSLGKTAAPKSIDLTSRNNGFVETLEFEEGTFIEKGTIVASLRKNQERANYQSVRVRWQNALADLKRQQELFGKQLIPKSILDNAITLEEQLRNDADSAKSRLQDQLIEAPFSGMIGIRRVSLGSFIRAGEIITTLDDIDQLLVDFSFPAFLLTRLSVGLPIVATINNSKNGDPYSGKIIAINTRVDSETQSILLRASIDNRRRLLKPGLLLNIEVIADRRDGILIPEEALVQRLDQSSVWVASDKPVEDSSSWLGALFSGGAGKGEIKKAILEKRVVNIISRQQGWVELTGDISDGDLVLIRGLTKVRAPNTMVIVKEIWNDAQVKSKVANIVP